MEGDCVGLTWPITLSRAFEPGFFLCNHSAIAHLGAALPDYLVEENHRLVQLFGESDSVQVDTYFVYPEELKTVARVQVFRDFVVSKAQRWPS